MKKLLHFLSVMTIASMGMMGTSAQAALDQRYGVIIGEPIRFQLEPTNCDVGNFLHYEIYIKAPPGQGTTQTRTDPNNCNGAKIFVCNNCFKAVIDVFQDNTDQHVAHREIIMNPANAHLYNGIFDLTPGLHELPSHLDPGARTGGALDMLRHPGLLADIRTTPLKTLDGISNPLVKQGTSPGPDLIPGNADDNNSTIPTYDAILTNQILNGLLSPSQSVGLVYVFGELFDDSTGIHNVHQNQGNDPGSQFASSNGIFQDGLVIFEDPRDMILNGEPLPSRRFMTMTRFQAQRDFTFGKTHLAANIGDGVATPFVFTKTDSKRITKSQLFPPPNFDVEYGPFANLKQLEVTLSDVSGDPDLLVQIGSDAPFVSANSVNLPEFIRAYNQANLPVTVRVRPKTGLNTWTLKVTGTTEVLFN
jgi:hypothetical protein